MPTWRTYPPYIVEPVNEEDDGDDDDDDDDGGVVIITNCNLWFFNVCLFAHIAMRHPLKPATDANFVQICIGGKFKSLKWTLPPGIYPP